jgi:hypothetical protein
MTDQPEYESDAAKQARYQAQFGRPYNRDDPADRARDVLEAIAAKAAKAPAVDSQGKPIPGKLRWGRTQQ